MNSLKTKIVTANGFQYELVAESDPCIGMAKAGDYTLSCTGTVFKYDSQPVLWLEGCPRIVASNDPALKDVLPVLPQYEDTREFYIIDGFKTVKEEIAKFRDGNGSRTWDGKFKPTVEEMAEAIKKIKEVKNMCVRNQDYEVAGLLRDAEGKLLKVEIK